MRDSILETRRGPDANLTDVVDIAIAEHEAIHAAILARDAASVRAMMERHIVNAAQRVGITLQAGLWLGGDGKRASDRSRQVSASLKECCTCRTEHTVWASKGISFQSADMARENPMLPDASVGRALPWARLTRPANLQALGLLPALLIVSIAFDILSGGLFLSRSNIGVLGHQVAVNMVLATGMTFVIIAGGIDLSISSILAACIIVGLLASNIAGLSPFWPLASLGIGLGFGLLNGALVSVLRLPPFILTLGTMTVVLGVARAITGDLTVYNVALPYSELGSASVFGLPVLAVLGFVVVTVAWFVLKRTVLGLSIYSVGGNEAAARLAGVPILHVAFASYGASGLAAGVGAVMLASKLQGANALQVGQSYTLDAITAVILGGTSFVGGTGSVWGTLAGALLIVVLSNGLILIGVSDTWQTVVKGAVVIGAVAIDRARLATAYA